MMKNYLLDSVPCCNLGTILRIPMHMTAEEQYQQEGQNG